MDISIISGALRYPGMTMQQAIDHLRWEARFADSAGFGSLWLLERHFSAIRSTGAPGAILAHIAAQTERIKIGYGVALLGIHHPVRFAEEIIWLDWLSGGRVLVGLSTAISEEERAVFGVPESERRARFEEHLAILRGALSQETLAWSGQFWSFPEVVIDPPALRPGAVPLFIATTTVESAMNAARRDLIMMVGNRPLSVIQEQISAYRAVHAELGRDSAETERLVGQTVANRRIYLGRSTAEAESVRATAEAATRGAREQLAVTDSRYREGAPPLPIVFETPYTGEPAGLVEELRAFEAAGVGQVILGLGAGGYGLSAEVLRRQFDLIASDVLPAFPPAVPVSAVSA